MSALTQTLATLGMALISVSAGTMLAEVVKVQPLLHILERRVIHSRVKRFTGTSVLTASSGAPYSKIPDISCIMLGCSFWIGSAILCATYPPFQKVTFSMLLSPLGAILRWYLSRLNLVQRSKKAPYWPLGTLCANLLATVFVSAAFVAQNVGEANQNRLSVGITACHALYGVQEGFCGCLSTISTFAVELQNIKTRRAVGYSFGSWLIGLIICVIIVGSPWWSIGMYGKCAGMSS